MRMRGRTTWHSDGHLVDEDSAPLSQSFERLTVTAPEGWRRTPCSTSSRPGSPPLSRGRLTITSARSSTNSHPVAAQPAAFWRRVTPYLYAAPSPATRGDSEPFCSHKPPGVGVPSHDRRVHDRRVGGSPWPLNGARPRHPATHNARASGTMYHRGTLSQLAIAADR